jgi:hypothetical protein
MRVLGALLFALPAKGVRDFPLRLSSLWFERESLGRERNHDGGDRTPENAAKTLGFSV